MEALLDGLERITVLNDVKVIIPEHGGLERHVTVTLEGIIIDLVQNGEIVHTISYAHAGIDQVDKDDG